MIAAPEQVSSLAEFSTIPDDPDYPDEARATRVLALAALYDGPAEEGEAVVAPLRSFGEPLLDFSAKLPHRAIQGLYDPLFPKGRDRSYFRSLYLPRLDEPLIGEIVAGLAVRPSEMTFSSVWYFGEVVRSVAADATAFGDRSQPWLFSIDAIWSKREQDAENVAWYAGSGRQCGHIQMAGYTSIFCRVMTAIPRSSARVSEPRPMTGWRESRRSTIRRISFG